MVDISAVIRLRPTRVALLVRPNDTRAIRRFMRVSACMWGGNYNPIIPVFRNPPQAWRKEFKGDVTGFKIARGYIQFFEPDVFIEAEKGLLDASGLGALRSASIVRDHVLPLSDLLRPEPNRDWSELFMGQSIIDVLRNIYDTERRFALRDEHQAYLIRPERNTALVEALFGVYPSEKLSRHFGRGFEDVYKPHKLKSGHEAWRKVFMERGVTPLITTRYGIDLKRSWQNNLVVFIFDPKQSIDLIDLWNMRSEPNPLLPVPIAWFPDLAEDIRKVIIGEFRPLQGNPNGVMRHATVEFSRGIKESAIERVVENLRQGMPPSDEKGGQSPLVIKQWRNRVWDHHNNDFIRGPFRMQLSAKKHRTSLSVNISDRATVEFETLSPDFAKEYGGHGLRWVNSIQLSHFRSDSVATIFPFNTFDRRWPHLTLGMDPVMIGSEGWVFGQHYKNTSQTITLPSQEEAVIGSLKVIGVEAELSEPGHIAKQILEHLQNLWGVHLLADIDTLKLLNKMAGGIRVRKLPKSNPTVDLPENDEEDESEELFDRRSSSLKTWIDLVSRRQADQTLPKVTLENFTERNVIRLGIETSCPHCRVANWNSIDVATYELTCKRCLKKYPFPQAKLRKGNKNWAYRVIGPFSVPDYARGSYGALVALSTISNLNLSFNTMTFSTALSMTFDGITREADYVVWHQRESMDQVRPPEMLIGEAKSLGQGELIRASDISKLQDLGKKLPGATLVVSVLRSDFTDSEKKLLRRLVKWGRRLDPVRDPTNRVLLLTINEMRHSFGPLSSRWEKLGGKYAKFADFHNTRNLNLIADATVAIYLGMPSFVEERQEAWEKRQEAEKTTGSEQPPGKWGKMLTSIKTNG